jgi:hypothetical protein
MKFYAHWVIFLTLVWARVAAQRQKFKMPTKKSVPAAKAPEPKKDDDSEGELLDYETDYLKALQDHDMWLKVQQFAERLRDFTDNPTKVVLYFFPGKTRVSPSHFDPSQNELQIVPVFGLAAEEGGGMVKLNRARLVELMDDAKYVVVSESEWRKLDTTKPVNRLVINMKQKTSHGHTFYPVSIDSRDNELPFVKALFDKYDSQIETPTPPKASAVSVDDI